MIDESILTVTSWLSINLFSYKNKGRFFWWQSNYWIKINYWSETNEYTVFRALPCFLRRTCPRGVSPCDDIFAADLWWTSQITTNLRKAVNMVKSPQTDDLCGSRFGSILLSSVLCTCCRSSEFISTSDLAKTATANEKLKLRGFRENQLLCRKPQSPSNQINSYRVRTPNHRKLLRLNLTLAESHQGTNTEQYSTIHKPPSLTLTTALSTDGTPWHLHATAGALFQPSWRQQGRLAHPAFADRTHHLCTPAADAFLSPSHSRRRNQRRSSATESPLRHQHRLWRWISSLAKSSAYSA